MTEERIICKTYAEMLAVLREAKASGNMAWWNSEELRRRTDRLRQEGGRECQTRLKAR